MLRSQRPAAASQEVVLTVVLEPVILPVVVVVAAEKLVHLAVAEEEVMENTLPLANVAVPLMIFHYAG